MSTKGEMMNTKLCIILVNYNGFTDTAACIASILESDRNDYQIIVVDNGSTVVAEENTLTYIKRNSIYLETGANLVFVVKHDGKEVLLPDIPDCVKEVDDKNKVVTVHIMKGLLDL